MAAPDAEIRDLQCTLLRERIELVRERTKVARLRRKWLAEKLGHKLAKRGEYPKLD